LQFHYVFDFVCPFGEMKVIQTNFSKGNRGIGGF